MDVVFPERGRIEGEKRKNGGAHAHTYTIVLIRRVLRVNVGARACTIHVCTHTYTRVSTCAFMHGVSSASAN